MLKCPDYYTPGCSCYINALEPDEQCWYHGWPNRQQCPYCGLFRGDKPCKRCGCFYGLRSVIEYLK